jgi:hypothetical protein
VILVHICCSVDSHYFLQKIKEDYPDDKIIGFFYDPNIHPYSEYRLRLFDVQRSCKILNIELIEGDYDLENWLQSVKGLENEPEKGDRCTICFDKRLTVSVQKALELGCDKFTTTLLISPKKSQDKLKLIGEELSKEYHCEFIFKDYRSGNGMELQSKEVKQNQLYRQNYCGCLFGLTAQRVSQNKLLDEMISPINKQILPESIEERLELYEKVYQLQEININFKVIKNRFLNYRLLSGKVINQKKVIDSYFIAYSTLKNQKTNGKIEYSIDNIHYLNRDEVKIIDLEHFNLIANSTFKSVQELNYNPLTFEKELVLKDTLLDNRYDLSTLIVLDTIIYTKLEIYLNSKVYEDVKETIKLI